MDDGSLRFNIKYFYTTASMCTASLAAVDACLSQSYNNIIFKYEVSGSSDYFPSASRYSHMSSTRMSEFYSLKRVPMFILEEDGSQYMDGLEFVRHCGRDDDGTIKPITQDTVNKWFNTYSSSLG